MKRILVIALSIIGFILIAAPTAVEYHPLLLNGKQFANAVVVQGGIIAVSLEDFARAGGAGPSLEPGFRLQGNTLVGIIGPIDNPAAKIYDKPLAVGSPQTNKVEPVAKIKMAPGQLFRVLRSGPISTRVFMMNGKAYIPLDDLSRAFGGGVFNQRGGTLKPGQAIQLNFTPNANALIGLL